MEVRGHRKPRACFQSADILPHLIQKESSGRVGVIGPDTRYGNAEGLGQVLPSTGAGVAKSLGITWQPDLMTGTTPAAAAYQRKIAQGYLDEALNATGNVTDALKYYHGGPNRAIWGPKTNAYAAEILRQMGAQ